jgi:hypothetical protein
MTVYRTFSTISLAKLTGMVRAVDICGEDKNMRACVKTVNVGGFAMYQGYVLDATNNVLWLGNPFWSEGKAFSDALRVLFSKAR